MKTITKHTDVCQRCNHLRKLRVVARMPWGEAGTHYIKSLQHAFSINGELLELLISNGAFATISLTLA